MYHTIYVLSKNKKNIKHFSRKFSIFTTLEKSVYLYMVMFSYCITETCTCKNVHGCVFVIIVMSTSYLPVFPKNPVAWHSSRKVKDLYFLAKAQILLKIKEASRLY